MNSNFFDATNISYLLGIHKLHSENSRCAEVPINLGGIDATSNVRRQPSEVIQTFFTVFGLIQEIQFLIIITENYYISTVFYLLLLVLFLGFQHTLNCIKIQIQNGEQTPGKNILAQNLTLTGKQSYQLIDSNNFGDKAGKFIW